MADLDEDGVLAIVVAAVVGPYGMMVASAAYAGCEWHAVVAVDVAEAAAANGDSSDFGVDCEAVAVAFVAAAVAAIGEPQELDYRCDLETVAIVAGILNWKQMTSVTLPKDVAVAAVVVAGNCHLLELACPGASASVVFVDLDVVALNSMECFHLAYLVVGVHHAFAGDSVGVAEHSAGPWNSDGEHSPCGDGVVVVGVEAEDVIL